MHTVCLRIKTMWVRLVKLKWAYVLCGPHLINWFCNSVSACIILLLNDFFRVLITLSVICQHIVRHSIKFGWAVESGWSTFVHYLGFFIFLSLFSPVCVHVCVCDSIFTHIHGSMLYVKLFQSSITWIVYVHEFDLF